MAVLDAAGLREYLRDHKELNVLIGREETSDSALDAAIEDAIDDFNTTPHKTSYTNDNFPSKSLLKTGAAFWVLKSAGIEMSRNHLNYSDGGMSVEVYEKTPFYQSWIDRFQRDWEAKKRAMKAELNFNACWGGV